VIEGEREEFERQLAILFAGVDKPLGEAAREAFWKGLQRMELVEFARCVTHLLADLESSDGPPKRFSLADIWHAKRELRAKAPPKPTPTQQAELAWDGDRWDLRANTRLFKHVTRTLSANPRRYGPPWSGTMREHTRRLVAAKNAWAADMRDLDDQGADAIPERTQVAIWQDYIGRAEQSIAQQALA